ncbi:MAG: glycosyl hydrolase, partial [Lapillicoccus sp.]
MATHRLTLRRRPATTSLVVAGVTAAAALGCAVAVGAAAPAAAADWLDAATATAQSMPTYPSTYANRGIRVGPGVNPPTGSWIAPAVFVGDGTARPVFTGPLAVKPSPQGFGVMTPTVTGTAKTVFGGYTATAALALAPPRTDAYTLTRRDSLSADLTYSAAGATVGVLTLAQGWAYAQYVAATDQDVRLIPPSGAGSPTAVPGGYRIGPSLLLVTPGTLSGSSLHLGRGQAAWVAGVAPGATPGDLATLARGATTLRGGTTGYAVSGGRAITTYALDTGSVPTVFAAMPAQSDVSGSRLVAAYPSINGPMPAVTGTTFTTSTPAYDVPVDLDLSTLSAADRSTLTGLVSADTARVATIDATDSYYAGKQLTRAVQVYRLARQLGLASAAASLKAAVVAKLDQWFDPDGCAARSTSCFGYDRVLKGVVGEQPSYGSDTEFNDHHFHYGYLLYAAGAMALDDPALTSRWRTMADTVAADIAAPRATATTVARRHFDDYAGHGWASGVAPFADGNNQESSSEATNAWVGVTLWGRASGNPDLATQGQWMFSREAASAVAYWLKPAPVAGFTSPMASLVWGGKKDYATWFSGEPSAIVGIQVLPAAPAQLAYLRSVGPAQLDVLADSALGAGISGKPLVDWSVALTSLGDRARAQAAYAQLTDGDIDNGNTRSYLYAVLHTSGTLPAPTGSTSSTTTSSPTTSSP